MPIARLFTGLLDLLAPPRCPGCDHLHAAALPFCEACAPLLEPVPGAGRERGVWRFEGPLADAVHRFKYRGRSDLGAGLAQALFLGWRERPPVDRVTAVPLHPARLRVRGYNQSALLATALARQLGARLDLGALGRVRDTASQVGQPVARRRENVRGAFRGRVRVTGARLLVVDDVRTSGATLAEACNTLRAAGAREVWGLALAQAELGGTTPR